MVRLHLSTQRNDITEKIDKALLDYGLITKEQKTAMQALRAGGKK